MRLLVLQAMQAQARVDIWQADCQEQQTAVQSALDFVQSHLQTSIQSCKATLSQLQHWLSLPEASQQQDNLSRQLQEAEQQLNQLRQEAQQCELEVGKVSQQQMSHSQRPFESSALGAAGIAGTAQAASSNSDQGTESSRAGSDQASNGASNNGAAGHGWASFRQPDHGSSRLMQSAQSSRGHKLWQPASTASTSTSTTTMTASAAAVVALPVR